MEIVKILPKQGQLTPTGWVLPATLSQDEWADIGIKFNAVSGAVQWAWGDWWNAGNFEQGERKRIVESDGWNGPAYQTLKDYGMTSEKFARANRLSNVSFRHHRECSSLPNDESSKLLEWCEKEQPTIKRIIEKVKEVKAWLAQGWTTDQIERKELIESGYTVVASQKKNDKGVPVDNALIAWADQQNKMVEIGRNTKWGNPFEMPADGNRDTVCDNYEDHYFPYKLSLNNKINELRGNVLVCWCYPERCHGDFLKEMANEA